MQIATFAVSTLTMISSLASSDIGLGVDPLEGLGDQQRLRQESKVDCLFSVRVVVQQRTEGTLSDRLGIAGLVLHHFHVPSASCQKTKY